MGWKTLTTLALTACLAGAATPAHAESGVTELVKPGTHSGVGCYAGWFNNTASLLCDDDWVEARILLQVNEDNSGYAVYSGYYRVNLFAGEALTQKFFPPVGPSLDVRVVWLVRDGTAKNGINDGRVVMQLS